MIGIANQNAALPFHQPVQTAAAGARPGEHGDHRLQGIPRRGAA